MSDTVKRMFLITDDCNNINLSILFSESKAKAIYKKIKDKLLQPKVIEDLMNTNEKCTAIKIRSYINKNNINEDELLSILNENCVINDIASDLYNNELKQWGMSKKKSSNSSYKIKGASYSNRFIIPAQISSVKIGNIVSIDYLSNKVSLNFDTIERPKEEIDRSNIIKNRFLNYQFSFSSRIDEELSVSFDVIYNTVQQIITDYIYNKVGMMKSIYDKNLFQVNSIKELVNSGKADEIFNAKINEASIEDIVDGKNNTFDSIDLSFFKDDFDIKFHDKSIIIYSNKFKFNESNYKNILKQYADDIQSMFQFAMNIIDNLYNDPSFDNSDNILLYAEEGWINVAELANKILNC